MPKPTKPLAPTIDPKTAALKAKRLAAAGKPVELTKPPAPIAAEGGPEIAAAVAAKAAPAPVKRTAAAKPAVTTDRTAELVAALKKDRTPLEQARFEQAVMAETGWKPVHIARLIEPDSQAKMGKVWDAVIFRKCLLHLEAAYQEAAVAGSLTLPQVGELFRVPSQHRPQLFAFIGTGAKLSAVHSLATELARPVLAKQVWRSPTSATCDPIRSPI